MTKTQQFSIISITASALAIWLFIITQVPPRKDDSFTLFIFFLTFVVWLGSSLAFILFLLRVKQSNREIIYAHIRPAIRQGFIVSTTLAMLLFLQYLRVMTLWEGFLVLLLALFLELGLRHTPFFGKE